MRKSAKIRAMGREKAVIANFPPGGYFCIKPALINVDQAEQSWKAEGGSVDGVSGSDCGLVAMVTQQSPLRMRRAVEQMACYFRRELDYDCLQYAAVEKERDAKTVAFLWADDYIDDKGRVEVLGACCFRWRHYFDGADRYALQWIWIHPYRRRQGHLTKAWPYFEKRFGEFIVEGPLSRAMRVFLATKTKYNDLLARFRLAPLKGETDVEE